MKKTLPEWKLDRADFTAQAQYRLQMIAEQLQESIADLIADMSTGTIKTEEGFIVSPLPICPADLYPSKNTLGEPITEERANQLLTRRLIDNVTAKAHGEDQSLFKPVDPFDIKQTGNICKNSLFQNQNK